ncbi:hypothetical protein ACQ4PT_044600 [Festuca glaucescens]
MRSASAVHAARRRVPLLLVPTVGSWSLADDSISQTPMPTSRSLPFRFASLSFRFASPRGWALSVTIDFAVTLQNPFTGASESLPALPSPFRVYRSTLQNMLWDRSPDAVMVSPGPGKGAYFCRLPAPDGGSWSPVAGCSQATDTSSITYCDGTFYLLEGRTRKVMAVDGTTFAVAYVIEPPDMVAPSPTRSWRTPETTLVASSGELLLIVRSHLLFKAGCRDDSESEGLFKAFRADSRSPAAGWSEIAGGDIGEPRRVCGSPPGVLRRGQRGQRGAEELHDVIVYMRAPRPQLFARRSTRGGFRLGSRGSSPTCSSSCGSRLGARHEKSQLASVEPADDIFGHDKYSAPGSPLSGALASIPKQNGGGQETGVAVQPACPSPSGTSSAARQHPLGAIRCLAIRMC